MTLNALLVGICSDNKLSLVKILLIYKIIFTIITLVKSRTFMYALK